MPPVGGAQALILPIWAILFNPVWAAGIELIFDGRYRAAVAKLTEADKLVPNLVDVKRQL